MRNFYEVNGECLFNSKIYMDEWAKSLEIIMPNGEFNKAKLQSLASLSKNLWDGFNTDRDETKITVKNKNYMESPQDIRAYLASFLLPNIERVFALLVKDENSTAIKNTLLNTKEELVIADFGSGPLSATVGFICALEYLLQQDINIFSPKKIKIIAIERSEKAFQLGRELLQNSFIDNSILSIERITSTEKISTNIDIALCSNIFNEVPTKHRLVNLINLHNKLNINGAVLIIEPGQDIHAKALGNLRDEFLNSVENCEIISPCSHKMPCPLSSSSNRTDWCWFRHGWNQPAALKEIEKFSKIDHHFLNFSYLFFVKSMHKMNEPFYARIVSDKLNVNFEKQSVQNYFLHNMEIGDKEELENSIEYTNLLKVLMCTDDGSLKSTLFSELDEEEFKRGMRLARKNSLKYLFSERQ